MKKLINILLMAFVAVALAGCYTADTDADTEGTDARITISPTEISFAADGTTTDGQPYGTYIVTVNPKSKMYESWTAELVNADWATLDYHTTDPDGVVEKALRITCSANTNWSRTGILRVTLDKTGESADFSVVQAGLKEDATLELSTEELEIMASSDDPSVVTFETNMGASTVAVSLEYLGEESGWLEYTLDVDAGTITITAAENESQTDSREAVMTVSAGSVETSYIEKQIAITQLSNVTYLFIYGSGLPRYATLENAAQMTKNDLAFSFKQYFKTGTVIVTTSRSSSAYPRFALNLDGTVTELADASAEASAPEVNFDIAGVNTLMVLISQDSNLNIIAGSSSAEFTRVTTDNCVPDDGVSEYDTKEYVTRDGGAKTWMTSSLHWNGGDSMGTYKLGSGLVAGSQTGGYGSTGASGYGTRNPAYDTQENGGELAELMMDDGVTTRGSVYGRLYSTYEALTGAPAGALSDAYLMSYPLGEPGDVIMDAIGTEITLENLLVSDLTVYTSNEDGDAQMESDHPSVCMQIQGICPYGWHIANLQDWRDLMYAASQVSSDYTVDASQAYYAVMANGSVSNVTAILRLPVWQDDEFNASTEISSASDSFGFNLYPNGWRLFATGYDYGSGSGNVRVYHAIPMMGQYTSSKMCVWRFYSQATNTTATFNDGFDIGNGCGNPVRCVKNYENF